LIAHIRKQLPKATPEQKYAKEKATIERWQQMLPEGREEYRDRYAATWAKMDDVEKKMQREKITERLRAIPAQDRNWIIKGADGKEGKHE
jgi:hypothetical protein